MWLVSSVGRLPALPRQGIFSPLFRQPNGCIGT
nr:MAG TPA: hypothetical protein [Bacteriophage sp.]